MGSNKNKKISKGLTDIVMIAGLVSCSVSTGVFEKSKEAVRNGAKIEDAFAWGSMHCVLSLVFIGLILIHLWQHKDFIWCLFTKKMFRKNKMTTLTLLVFVLTVLSIMLYLQGFTFGTLHFHSMIAHLFVLIVVIHLVLNFRKGMNLFKVRKIKKSQLIENPETIR